MSVIKQIEFLDVGSKSIFIDVQPLHARNPQKMPDVDGYDTVHITPSALQFRAFTRNSRLNMMLNGGRLAFIRMMHACRDILSQVNPQAILLCHDQLFVEAAFVDAAKQLGIPTIFVQEGPFRIIKDNKPTRFASKMRLHATRLAESAGIVPAIAPYGLADYAGVLCASEHYRKIWVRAGANGSRVHVVGVPRFDALREAIEPEPEPDRSAQRRIVLISQPFASDRFVTQRASDDLLEMLARGLNKAHALEPFTFNIRLHPRASEETAQALTSRLDFPFGFDDNKTAIEKSIARYDCVIGHYSTALLESIIKEKNTIIVPVPKSGFLYEEEANKQAWFESIGVPVAYDSDECARTILDVIRSETRTSFASGLEDECGLVDGKASRRAAVFIQKIVSIPNSPVK
ncbi:polysialyltransferase family glycosyltransferase [Xanthobacter pseudotagetidis]|uniref:polysialyltransferase family glycosyltransferase n=1 Tax=Xanthobacter pseudotagetidis TaxID=3119911 RepID=UPI0037282C63